MREVNTPENEEQLVEILQQGLEDDYSFSISGHNTKAGFGYEQTTRADICTRALTGILEYDPAELVMRARAGTALAEIEQVLAQHRQYLAFEPPNFAKLYDEYAGSGTIGGAFMANLSGPRRFFAGAARDHILGIHAVSGRAEKYKSGGNVIKNVTGYDLSKLLTGSWGTLSILSEISFKVLPAPRTSVSLGIEGLSEEDGLNLLSKIAQSTLQVSGLAYIPLAVMEQTSIKKIFDGSTSLTLCRLEGSTISVSERVKALRQLVPENISIRQSEIERSELMWKTIGNLECLNTEDQHKCLVKLSLPQTQALNVTKLLNAFAGCHWFADAAGAVIFLSLDEEHVKEQLTLIRQSLKKDGGSAVLYRAHEQTKKELGVFSQMSAGLFALNNRIKNSFDPKNILNPNRLFLAE